ncbi:hypothetical protein RclHR1_10110012 [Rhizophagus clarus]|uniref:Uncharacterized protein n=1 Tax=Rhizophagus clarus TaxID=94130 RepID=A0A2Z6Q0T0_9GLOM|nr:hypothetical protein RclHR1_10110012 [Rhizophagus clarus]
MFEHKVAYKRTVYCQSFIAFSALLAFWLAQICLIKELQGENTSNLPNPKDNNQGLATQVHQIIWHSATCNFAYPVAYYGINTLTAYEINKILFQLAANLECIGIHTYGSVCDGAGENRNHIKSFDWWASSWSLENIVEVDTGNNNYERAKIIAKSLDCSKFTVQLLDSSISNKLQVDRNSLRQPMPTKQNWNINDSCEFKSPKDNKWHAAIITNINSEAQTFDVTILSNKEGWKVAIVSQDIYVRPFYDTQIHWTNYKTINPITGIPWFFISDPTHVFKKLRNNLSKSHTGEGQGRNVREIMIDGKEVSWRHIQGVYEYTARNSTAKITRLTKRHVWLTSWSKMRVDLAEHTLSKDVENAMNLIDELKEISTGTREFINYSSLYRQIFHSKKPLEGLADSRLQTLQKIYDWFVIRDRQKNSTINWISLQCQFDLLLSIQGFLGMIKEIFILYPDSVIEPRRVSQDMLEGLFGTIRQLGGDSSTQTLKGYGHALNKFRVTARMTSELKSVNYGKSNHTGMEFDCLTRYDYRKTLKNNNMHSTLLLSNATQLSNMSPFVRKIFEVLLLDDLFMGRIETPTLSFKKWRDDIKNIVLKSIPKNKGKLWTTAWISRLEINLNNYLCSGIWFLEFQKIILQNHSAITTQRLVAYFLVRKVIEELFKSNVRENRDIEECADPTLTSKDIVTLNQAESSKFSYIIEKVEYVAETKTRTTNIIPGPEFIRFMYYLESLVIELFKKHNELGPNILRYVKNSLLSNLPLNQNFITILKYSTNNNIELENEEFGFIYERCISIYMKSRQKTWRDVNNYIPEKGTANLRENLKSMRSSHLQQKIKNPLS